MVTRERTRQRDDVFRRDLLLIEERGGMTHDLMKEAGFLAPGK